MKAVVLHARIRQLAIAGIAVATLFLAGLGLWYLLPPRQPVFRGKPLSYWLAGYDGLTSRWAPQLAAWHSDLTIISSNSPSSTVTPGPDGGFDMPAMTYVTESLRADGSVSLAEPRFQEARHIVPVQPMPGTARPPPPGLQSGDADAAVRDAGAEAIPTLVRLLRARDSALKLKLLDLATNQSLIHFTNFPAATLNNRGLQGFAALGAAASPAVPQLASIYEHSSSPRFRLELADIIISLGPWGRAAIPAFVHDAQDGDPAGFDAALMRLRLVGAGPDVIAPLVVPWLKSPDAGTRSEAALYLAQFPGAPDQAVPALAGMLDDTVLTCRANAAIALGKYGASARPAIPKLLQHRNGNDMAGPIMDQALRQIDPKY